MPAQKMPALSMSQTKEDLVKYLGLQPETYALMAKETDIAYKWLTTGTQHLKRNCTREPPYDWSDITEASKEAAMTRLAQSGDTHTGQYWSLGDERTADGCPNWIARWFLYHKFRYRDGRNRGKESRNAPKYGNSSRSRTKSQRSDDNPMYYTSIQSPNIRTTISGYGSEQPTFSKMSPDSSYSSMSPFAYANSSPATNSTAPLSQPSFYDPVKGYWRPKD